MRIRWCERRTPHMCHLTEVVEHNLPAWCVEHGTIRVAQRGLLGLLQSTSLHGTLRECLLTGPNESLITHIAPI